MEEDGESVEPSADSTVVQLKSYFDTKFFSLKKELAEDQQYSSATLSKKLKLDSSVNFKFSGNRKQFDFNSEVLENLVQAGKFVMSIKDLVDIEDPENVRFSRLILQLEEKLVASSKSLKRRNKLIRIADKSEAGWAAVDEYLSDELASGSEDEKKIRAAELRALKKKRVKTRSPLLPKLSIKN
jgi:hypothetical protein